MVQSKSLRANDLIGDQVRTAGGEILGKIEDLILDPTTGSILYAVISFPGTSAVADKLHPVPWSLLRPSVDESHLVFEGAPNLIQRARAFDRKHWGEMSDATWQEEIRNYYGSGPIAPVRERVVVHKEIQDRRPTSMLAVAFGIVLLVALLGFGYMVSTRGWEQSRNSVVSYAQGVAYAAKETSEDAALTAKVKTALSLSRRVPSGNINVDTANHIVTLHGEMPNDETRSLAEMIARDTPGVQELHNELQVNPAATATAELERMRHRVADLETKYLVHDALTKNPGLSGQNIQVDVRDGTAVLSGIVETSDQKYLAEQTAGMTEGVTSVNSQLQVNAPASSSEIR